MQPFHLGTNLVFRCYQLPYLYLFMKYWYSILPVAGLCASTIGCFSCSRDSLPNPDMQLVGRWEWIESSNSDDDLKLTPAVTGHTSAMEFDNRGRACFFEDGHMTGAANFTVRYNRRKANQHLLIYHGYKGQQYYTIVGNRLFIQDDSEDTGGHIFSRVEPVATGNTLSNTLR